MRRAGDGGIRRQGYKKMKHEIEEEWEGRQIVLSPVRTGLVKSGSVLCLKNESCIHIKD